MAFHIQYDPATGEIKATVNSDRPIICESQIIVEDGWVPTDGKKVNLQTLELEDAPKEQDQE